MTNENKTKIVTDKPDAHKRKRQHTLPNRQVAQAFTFSADDLAANRIGFMTRAQEWGVPLALRGIFSTIEQSRLIRLLTFSRRKQVDHCCGRIRLQRELREIWNSRRVDVYEIHRLMIGDYPIHFPLNRQQYQALTAGIPYHVYYLAHTASMYQVLSLERALDGC